MSLLDEVAKEWMKPKLPAFEVGDTVEVHVQIREGEKERVQKFVGTVIGRKGGGVVETFRVRRIVQGEGVERIFPVHSPKVVEIAVVRKGKSRRAKLFYLRDRIGKATKLEEQFTNEAGAEAPASPAAPSKPAPQHAEPAAAKK